MLGRAAPLALALALGPLALHAQSSIVAHGRRRLRSLPPPEGHETSTNETGQCTAELLRRTSKSTPCWPSYELARKYSGGWWGCDDERTIRVYGKCTGLFMCSNSASTICAGHGAACQCSNSVATRSPCHINAYAVNALKSRGGCPPAAPFPPFPPP